MTYNYHAHTWRCSHATGTEEEYIRKAIAGGVTHMGFSDHAPFVFPDGYQSFFRIPEHQVADYFETLKALREKYRGQIDLKIGLEMEYYPLYFREMLDGIRKWGCEYLILGQHFIGSEHPDGLYSGKGSDREEDLREYADCVLAAMETGLFSYVAHPDIFRFLGDEAVYRREMKRICAAAKALNVPLEINFLGIREGRHYPYEPFWKLVGEEGARVTFGFDSHDVDAAHDTVSLKRAEELVGKYGLNYVGKPEIRLLSAL